MNNPSYNPAEIAACEADSMLDEMVHEFVMGRPKPKLKHVARGSVKDGWCFYQSMGAGWPPMWNAPKYSTDPALVWAVAQQLQRDGFYVQVSTLGKDRVSVKVVEPDADPEGGALSPWPKRHENADLSGPLAICRAAVLAKLSALFPGCAVEPAAPSSIQ